MAEGFIEEIYAHSMLLTEVKQFLENLNCGQSYDTIDKLNNLLPRLGEECKRYAEIDRAKGIALWGCLEELTGYKGNYKWLSDCLEGKIIPQYLQYLQTLSDICVDDEDGICLLSSQSGFLTMQATDSGGYFHSKLDPMWEAHILAEQLFHPAKREYFLYGTGLGYLPYQLYLLSDGSARLHIFEPRDKFIQYARAYGVLDWIPEQNVEITVTDNLNDFLGSVDEFRHGYHIQDTIYPFIREDQRELLSDILMNERTKRVFDRSFSINYFCNLSNVKNTILDFDRKQLKSEIIVVAAGPSLDDDMGYLKEMQGKKSIIAVGTVFSKLLKNGIRPDLVTVLDPQEKTLHQLDGLWEETVPLFIGNIAHWGFAEKYQGDKYLVLLDAYEYITANYGNSAQSRNIPRLKAGSTVAFLAVSLALYWNAKTIELVGMDYAYPGKMTHATDTMDYSEQDDRGLFMVEDALGGQVYTSEGYCACRRELEELIAQNRSVAFVNCSNRDAKIAGTVRRKA